MTRRVPPLPRVPLRACPGPPAVPDPTPLPPPEPRARLGGVTGIPWGPLARDPLSRYHRGPWPAADSGERPRHTRVAAAAPARRRHPAAGRHILPATGRRGTQPGRPPLAFPLVVPRPAQRLLLGVALPVAGRGRAGRAWPGQGRGQGQGR